MDAHRSQIIGGDADEDHTQIIGGMQPNYWGDIPPPGFGTPVYAQQLVGSNFAKNRENVKRELCLNVFNPFFITVCCFIVA